MSDFLFLDISEDQARKYNATWNEKRKKWRVPLTIGALKELIEDGHHEYRDMLASRELARQRRVSEKNKDDAHGDSRFRPYQRVDVEYLSGVGHPAIFNEQRTGKTPTALALCKFDDLNIIVCPTSLLYNWQDEIMKWKNIDSQHIYVANESKAKRFKMYENLKINPVPIHFIVVSYGTLKNDLDHILKNTKHTELNVILDEAHRIRNRNTEQTKAIFKLGRYAKRRMALTGTPVMNHASDLWSILHFLYPSKFPSYWQFVERYFYVNDGYFGKEIGRWKRKKELLDILEVMSVQRKREQVMRWLPAKQYIKYVIDANKRQAKAYNQLVTTFEVEQDGQIVVDAPSLLAQLTRLRQLTLSPEFLGVNAKSAKEEFLLDFLKDNTEPTIIFSNFTGYLKELQKKIKGSVILHGEMGTKERQEAVRTFQKGEKEINIILSNIEAGGVGWTLDRATTTIFLDRHYNPEMNTQAEDRMVSTTESNVTSNTVIDLVIKDTVDEYILDLVEQKLEVTKWVNNYSLKRLIR